MSFYINFLELYGSLPHCEGFQHQVLAQAAQLCVPPSNCCHSWPLASPHTGRDTTTKVIFPHCAASKCQAWKEGRGRKSHGISGPREYPCVWLGCSWPETEAPFSRGLWILICSITQQMHSCHLGQDGGTLNSGQIWQCLCLALPPQSKTLLKERHHRNPSSWKKQSKGLEKNKLITSETNSAWSIRRVQGKGQTENKMVYSEMGM